MRSLLLFIAAALFSIGVPATPATDFEIPVGDQTHSMLALSQNGPVYVDFWASWCGPCRRSFPFMNQLVQDFGDKGLTVVAINLDVDKQDADRFLTEFPANFAIVYDPDFTLAEAYQVGGMPSSYLIHRGEIIETHVGFRPKDAEQTRETLTRLLP
ncbi:Thiol-disulfide isomerase or thioredoxin [Ferrimonas sediminum]|uniref:Thiol-disulfide isomerase or thioredoxin n=1 Tax=Ferrimonas sediminum TaxID=718193 RepID=A0A1G8N6T3_9GAMM|nr:TlpA disulfide reductase family protein [Ferrimonas sediminum]SDI75843.1 Thiol-disulfide isomerase or thioredoxin [Ferrimonas sediminum]